jgi:prepilin-type N-terminal cleavage/methylation domain-containing protein
MRNPEDYVQLLRTNKALNMQPYTSAARNKQHGFSLVEILIGLSLAASGLLVIGQVFATAANTANLARTKEHAALAARDKLEYLSDLYFRDSFHQELNPGDHGPEDIPVWNPNNNKILDLFRITWSVGNVADPRPGTVPAALKITVTAIPVRNDGSSIDNPYFNSTIVLSTIVGPVIP